MFHACGGTKTHPLHNQMPAAGIPVSSKILVWQELLVQVEF